MQQFNNSDNSGMVGFLVGIIVLVFAGIVFSMMADKRFRFVEDSQLQKAVAVLKAGTTQQSLFGIAEREQHVAAKE